MARVLLVDDDADQLETRRLILAESGCEVWAAATAEEAVRLFGDHLPDCVVMDLRLPRREDGARLIRAMRDRSPSVRILVLSGWTRDLETLPERGLVDRVMAKPAQSAQVVGWVRNVAVLVLCAVASAQDVARIKLEAPSEATATIAMSAPGSDWAVEGREGAVADVSVNGARPFQVVLFTADRYDYRVFLGRLEAGEHEVRVARNAIESRSPLTVHDVRLDRAADACTAHAPVLYARVNTIGRFSDVPLLVYCETRPGELEYTVIFSNEDGGTSTRALMARWGRTADIEYVYRVFTGGDGAPLRAIIQAKDHKDVEFAGRREAFHPLLMPVTDNNMVSDAGESSLRFQLAPLAVRLSESSRERVMDENPATYRVMAQELHREGKLRPFGTVDGQKISDPRNYVYIEAKIANRASRIAAVVRLHGEARWRSSHLGRADYAIERDGWVRTTVELPPKTQPSQVAEIGFECLVEPPARERPAPVAGQCRLDAVSQAFFLDADYRPGASFFALPPAGRRIPTGETITFPAPRGH
jgi:CheY-like chemotaxis protein